MSRHPDGRAAIGDTRAELGDVPGLVTASQTHIVVLSIDGDVLIVSQRKLGNSGIDVLHASWFAHGLVL